MATAISSGIIRRTQNGPNTYSVTQESTESSFDPPQQLAISGVNLANRKDIVFEIGPIKIVGYVDIVDFGIRIEVFIFGFSIGIFLGNLKDGLTITINLIAAKGSVTAFIREGDLWVRIKLTPIWGKSIDIEQRLLDL